MCMFAVIGEIMRLTIAFAIEGNRPKRHQHVTQKQDDIGPLMTDDIPHMPGVGQKTPISVTTSVPSAAMAVLPGQPGWCSGGQPRWRYQGLSRRVSGGCSDNHPPAAVSKWVHDGRSGCAAAVTGPAGGARLCVAASHGETRDGGWAARAAFHRGRWGLVPTGRPRSQTITPPRHAAGSPAFDCAQSPLWLPG